MHGPFSGGLTGKYSFDEVPVIFNRKYFTRLFLYEHKESVIDTQTGEKVAGYNKDCDFCIGKTKRKEIHEDQLGQFKKDSLTFEFTDNPEEGLLVSIGAAGKYAASKGVKSGDPAQKALKIYGKPKAMILDYGKDEEHRIHWVFYGLFYENLAIFTDSAFTNVIGFTVGEGLDLKRRYIKK